VTIEVIKNKVMEVVSDYPISKIMLFGSRALQLNRDDSDVDLIIEFYETVSLLTLSSIKNRLEDILGLEVDVIHGPLDGTELIEIDKVVELYAS